MLTASTHYIIPSLIGRGLTDDRARDILVEAQAKGITTFVTDKTYTVEYSLGKYTIGVLRG